MSLVSNTYDSKALALQRIHLAEKQELILKHIFENQELQDKHNKETGVLCQSILNMTASLMIRDHQNVKPLGKIHKNSVSSCLFKKNKYNDNTELSK